ncbi:MmyB family transcriptional regulator [Halostreptopolyspora alba]|uniref:MmyB family transcriptional regulator n=1 Tax=Halostreptopolyspora alba TaxID=2487137 RepID=UPI0026CD3DF2
MGVGEVGEGARRATGQPVDRARDAVLVPEAVDGRARRTPGLRREEVADLAGVSVNYYERLEQARAPHPSPQVIDAIGRALKLSEVERAHLSRLAGHAPAARAGPAEQVPPGVLALLERLGPLAAYVCDARHDILAWNDLAAALVTDFGALPPAERNVLRPAMRPGATVCSAPSETAGGFEAHAAAQSREALTRRPPRLRAPAAGRRVGRADTRVRGGVAAARRPATRDAAQTRRP